MLADQMIVNHLIGDWQKLTVLTLATFNFWLAAQDFVPLIAAGWRVTRTSLVIVPANWVDVFTAAEKVSEELDFFISSGRMGDGRGLLSIFEILDLSLFFVVMLLPQ